MTLEKETSIYQLGAISAGIQDAVSIAESKNSIFHQATAPPTSGRKVGDIWYDSDDGFAMYKFDGTGWTQEQFGTNAISAGSVTAARLDAQDVYTNFLRVYFLSAAQAEIESLSAITANLGSVIVGGLNNEDGVITIKNASDQTIGYWNNTGLFAQVATITGDITTNQKLIFTSTQTTANGRIALEMGDLSVIYNTYQASYGYIAAGGAFLYTDEILTLTSTSTYNKGVYADKLFVDTLYMQGDIISNAYIYVGEVQAPTIRANNLYAYTGVDFMNGKVVINSNGLALFTANLYCRRNDANAWIQTENVTGGNAISIEAHTDGTVLLWSRAANGTAYPILQRANNSSAITTYGNWTASGSWLFNDAFYLAKNGDQYIHCRLLTSGSTYTNQILCGHTGNNLFFGYGGYANNVGATYFDGNEVHIRTNTTITFEGAAVTFNKGVKNANNSSGAPITTPATSAAVAVSDISSRSSGLSIYGQWESSWSSRSLSVPSSDIRLKEHIKDSTITALPLINAIRMREFDWTDGRHQTIGFVADELEELDSKLSIGGGTNDDGTMNIKSVDTFYLLGYLTKAVQELSAEVNRLKGAA